MMYAVLIKVFLCPSRPQLWCFEKYLFPGPKLQFFFPPPSSLPALLKVKYIEAQSHRKEEFDHLYHHSCHVITQRAVQNTNWHWYKFFSVLYVSSRSQRNTLVSASTWISCGSFGNNLVPVIRCGKLYYSVPVLSYSSQWMLLWEKCFLFTRHNFSMYVS